MLKSLLREPLVHFLLLGTALFVLDVSLRPTVPAAATGEIVVSEARVRSLAHNFARTWQRPPTREELDGLIESHVREEVMVREALALGLDRDDAIIRRRLQQKMEFVSEEAAALARPTEEELEVYMKAHPESFRAEPRVSFAQVYLDPRKRSTGVEAEAKRLLDGLNRAGATPDLGKLGDRLLLLESTYQDVPQSDVARLFGTEFADALVRQPTGRWVGPLTSGYGVHLVKVEALGPGGARLLNEVRSLVEREWANVKRKELAKAFYEKLRTKYTIAVQMPETAKP
jgi:hypothetical protein